MHEPEPWILEEQKFFLSLGWNPTMIYVAIQRMKEQRKIASQDAFADGHARGYQIRLLNESAELRTSKPKKPKPR